MRDIQGKLKAELTKDQWHMCLRLEELDTLRDNLFFKHMYESGVKAGLKLGVQL